MQFSVALDAIKEVSILGDVKRLPDQYLCALVFFVAELFNDAKDIAHPGSSPAAAHE